MPLNWDNPNWYKTPSWHNKEEPILYQLGDIPVQYTINITETEEIFSHKIPFY